MEIFVQICTCGQSALEPAGAQRGAMRGRFRRKRLREDGGGAHCPAICDGGGVRAARCQPGPRRLPNQGGAGPPSAGQPPFRRSALIILFR
jgi:hypothetical protein